MPTMPDHAVATQPPPHRPPLRATGFGGLPREHGFELLRVEGELPVELRGMYLRNGPAVFDEGVASHWFDGNGAVAAVRLLDGAAEGAVRELHTPSADEDRARRRPRSAGFARRMSFMQKVRVLFGASAIRNVANINVLPWQDRLFALYESAPPVELDPATLDSLGEIDLGGVINGAWNAHPRRVPARRATYQFGVRVGLRSYLDIYELPDDGAVRQVTSIRLPFVTEIHDCLATDRHLIFLIPPCGASALCLLAKGAFVDALVPRPSDPTRVLVVPIDDPERVTIVETEPFFSFHGFNAYEQGGEIVLDLVTYPDFETAHAHVLTTSIGGDHVSLGSEVVRVVVDPARGRARVDRFSSRPCEFPRTASMVQGRRHRHGWAAAFDVRSEGRGWFDRLVAFDFETGASRELDPGPNVLVGEPELVARSDREDDVWVLSMLGDLERGASCLAVWDGRSASDEPVAKVWFDQLLPPGLHGGFQRA
jgi:all-trans-8'-apo-beta-carotenal 15,15'-oxygenase